jgi:hypothetical protein
MAEEAEPTTMAKALTLSTGQPVQYLNVAAYHLYHGLRELTEAAATMGMDTQRYHQLTGWAEAINRHINPPDTGRIGHGQQLGRAEA